MTDTDETIVFDGSTRASEIVRFFRSLMGGQNRHIADAIAITLKIRKSSTEFYAVISGIAQSITHLKSEIGNSSLRSKSKDQYILAAQKLYDYLLLESLQTRTTDQLISEESSLVLLNLLDDVLEPAAARAVTIGLLGEWADTLDALLKSAEECFTDPNQRFFVIRQLSGLRWAVQNFKALGIEEVSRAFGAMMMELKRSEHMAGAQAPEARSWYQKATAPLVALGASIIAISAVAEPAEKLISHGINIYEIVTQGTYPDSKEPGKDVDSSRSKADHKP